MAPRQGWNANLIRNFVSCGPCAVLDIRRLVGALQPTPCGREDRGGSQNRQSVSDHIFRRDRCCRRPCRPGGLRPSTSLVVRVAVCVCVGQLTYQNRVAIEYDLSTWVRADCIVSSCVGAVPRTGGNSPVPVPSGDPRGVCWLVACSFLLRTSSLSASSFLLKFARDFSRRRSGMGSNERLLRWRGCQPDAVLP